MPRVKDLQTRYARTADGLYIAYQTAGDGPIDLIWQPVSRSLADLVDPCSYESVRFTVDGRRRLGVG